MSNKKCGYICWMLVALVGLLVFLILVTDEDLKAWTSENQGMASWVQAIFSVFAIVGVWWQTNKQLSNAKNISQENELQRRKNLFKKSDYLVRDCLQEVKRIKYFYDEYKKNRRAYLELTASKEVIGDQVFGPKFTLSSSDAKSYTDVLESASNHFLNLPFWDIENADLAGKMLAVHTDIKFLLLDLKNGGDNFSEVIDSLIASIESVQSFIAEQKN